MLNLIKFHLKKNKILLKDNLTLFLIMFFAYIINYVFHFYVGRTLGPEDYGVFGVLLSIIYIIVMPLMAIQTTLSRYVTELNVKNEKEKLAYLFSKSLKKRRSVINTVGIIRYGALRDRNRYEERVNKTKPTVVPKTNFSQELVFSMRFKKNVPGTVKQTSEAIKKDNNCRKKYVVGTF